MRKRLVSLAAGLTLFSILGILVLNGPAAAAPGDAGTNFYAYLNGGNEVPPTASSSDGMATFHVNYDGSLSYTVTAYAVPNVIMGHIHLGAFGTNGPVVLTLLPVSKPSGGPSNISVSGTATAADLSGPLKGQPMSALISQLSYNAYVNIHTSNGTAVLGPGNYPDGEIRGYTQSVDANRVGTQPAQPFSVALPTGVVPFTSTGPGQVSVPQIPVVAPITATSPSQNNSGTGPAAANTGTGGSTQGVASGAPTTGGSGASNAQPGNTPGFSGTGGSTGNSSGSTNLGAGAASGGVSTSNGASVPTGGGSGAGTIAHP